MPKAYTKEDLIGAALLRFALAGIDTSNLEVMFDDFYDKRGRDDFRKYACVDAEQMRIYFEWVN